MTQVTSRLGPSGQQVDLIGRLVEAVVGNQPMSSATNSSECCPSWTRCARIGRPSLERSVRPGPPTGRKSRPSWLVDARSGIAGASLARVPWPRDVVLVGRSTVGASRSFLGAIFASTPQPIWCPSTRTEISARLPEYAPSVSTCRLARSDGRRQWHGPSRRWRHSGPPSGGSANRRGA